MPRSKTGTTSYHAELGHPDKGTPKVGNLEEIWFHN